MKNIKRLPIIASIAIVSGCGGGGSESTDASSDSARYVVYSGNENRHVVLDGALTQFAVKAGNMKLVHLASASELNGLVVSDGGDINRNGQKIAAIILSNGQDGKKIAKLECTGPAPNYGAMTITVTSQSWIHSCASNTGGSSGGGSSSSGESGEGAGGGNSESGSGGSESGGGSGGSANTSGRNADQCVKLTPHQFGGLAITNTCNIAIEYSYCNLRDVSSAALFQCKARPHTPSPTGYIYGQGSSTLSPGSTRQILETAGVKDQRTWVKACASPDLPFISGFNTSTITSNSSAFGYCSR